MFLLIFYKKFYLKVFFLNLFTRKKLYFFIFLLLFFKVMENNEKSENKLNELSQKQLVQLNGKTFKINNFI